LTAFGYFLSCEEYGPKDLMRQARMAADAGFQKLWISDHFHPWLEEQGQSPFVWSVIGALSEAVELPVGTAVTCPTVRVHPAIVAQAAATAAVQLDGKFTLGVGSGEALNEHILGDPWPSVGVRLSMLEEAVDIIRTLHRGDEVSYHGEHYEVSEARIYTRPAEPVPIYVSGFGPQAAELAGRIGDGYVTTKPDTELIEVFRQAGGAGKPIQAGTKVCWAPTEADGVATAHRLWRSSALGGQLSQIIPRTEDFGAAAEFVPQEKVAEHYSCGPEAKKHVAQISPYLEAGCDEVYVAQIGGNFDGFFRCWTEEILPQLQ
jgi:G6PDH family F420-dependent oxidoreductase